MSVVTRFQTAEAVPEIRARPMFRFDPLLLLAALGLVACSLVTLKGATRTTNPGHPLFYVERQADLRGDRRRRSRWSWRSTDYTRLRKFKWPFYGMLIVLNIVVYGAPLVRGAHRWIPLPFFQFQSSEFGKILLVVSLAAFAVDRSRRLHERRTTAQDHAAGAGPGADRDPPARPRNRDGLRRRRRSRSCSSPARRGSS